MTTPPPSVQAQITLQSLTDDQMAKFFEQRAQNKISFGLFQPQQQGYPQPVGNAIVVGTAGAEGLLTAATIIKAILGG